MVPGGFLFGSHLTSFIVYFIIKVFIGILGAPKYKIPLNNKNRSPCLPFGGLFSIRVQRLLKLWHLSCLKMGGFTMKNADIPGDII